MLLNIICHNCLIEKKDNYKLVFHVFVPSDTVINPTVPIIARIYTSVLCNEKVSYFNNNICELRTCLFDCLDSFQDMKFK
jgi:hypothetical protein